MNMIQETFYDMNEIIQNDVVAVGGGDGRRGEGVELKARRPLAPPASPLMRGRRAEGVRSGKW